MRDLRIDFFRGVALIGITWNHTMPSQEFISKWGSFQLKTHLFFNFADVFIFISGIVCAIAFGSKISRQGWRSGVFAASNRIVQITIYNAIACLLCISIVVTFEKFGVHATHHYLSSSVSDSFWGSLLQYNAIPYFNILNMYIVLLSALPLFLYFYQKLRASLLLSAATYITSQVYYYTTDIVATPYFFGSIFSWQFLFFIGVTIGIERKNINKWIAGSRVIMPITLLYLFLGTYLFEMRYAYFHFTDKQYLGIFRILDILAITYLIITFLEKKALSNIRTLHPIIALGRNSLPIFSLSLTLCYLFSLISELMINSRASYLTLLLAEFFILYFAGWILSKRPDIENLISLRFIDITAVLVRNRRNNTLAE